MWKLNNALPYSMIAFAPEGEGTPGGGAPAPAPAETPATETPAPADENGFADISELLDLKVSEDTNENEPPAPGGETPPADSSKDGEPEGGKGEQPAPAPEPGEEGAKPEGETPATELAKLLKDVLAEAKGTPTEEKPTAPEYKPKYGNVNIPDPIMQALDNEDPQVRRQGMNAMLGAAMTKVYDDITAEMRATVKAQFDQVPAVLQARETQQETVRKMNEDFYGKYPQFNTPQGKKLTTMVAVQVAQSLGDKYKGWNEGFRDQLGQTLIELTGLQAAPAAATPPAGQKPAGKPASTFVAGGGARPGSAGQKPLGDEIMETIN